MKFAQFPQLSECGNKYSIDTDLLMMIYINTEWFDMYSKCNHYMYHQLKQVSIPLF